MPYADPPWDYGAHHQPHYSTEQSDHYATLSFDAVAAFKIGDKPVKDFAQDLDAVLFLWVTSPMLHLFMPIIEAWGFDYKTSFVWDKINHNMGHYNSVRHELLLVCVRGTCPKDSDTLIDSVQSIEAHRAQSQARPLSRNHRRNVPARAQAGIVSARRPQGMGRIRI